MNILMISPFDLVVRRFGGTTIRLVSLARELSQRGHTVILAGPPPFDGERPAFLDKIRIHYFRRPFHRYPYPDDGRRAERKRVNRVWRLPLVILSRWLEINRLIAAHRIDIVYVNRSYLDIAYPAFLSHLWQKTPIICDWDDLEGLHGFTTMFGQRLAIQLFESFNEVCFPRLADATVVASKYLGEFALKIGVPEQSVHYAPTVGDSVAFHPSIDGTPIRKKFGLELNKLLLYVGTLESGNGVNLESMLHALKHLVAIDSSYVLLIVGEGDLVRKDGEKGSLAKLADSLGLADNVIFTGGLPNAEIPSYVAAADLCLALFPVNMVTMSKSPLKVYEYMASGKAVIGRYVGEISNCIKNGETGLLVYTDDPVEYATAIIGCFSKSKDYLRQLGENARRAIEERFLWKHSADVVVNACEQLLLRR